MSCHQPLSRLSVPCHHPPSAVGKVTTASPPQGEFLPFPAPGSLGPETRSRGIKACRIQDVRDAGGWFPLPSNMWWPCSPSPPFCLPPPPSSVRCIAFVRYRKLTIVKSRFLPELSEKAPCLRRRLAVSTRAGEPHAFPYFRPSHHPSVAGCRTARRRESWAVSVTFPLDVSRTAGFLYPRGISRTSLMEGGRRQWRPFCL
ncbi:uncharacterized protein LY79DRAFT_342318 [Colletotrichum navitas]|uniref:Uncharacterized protein n=1 Tax=Colletotrichum navitas TaxID=681940 RepID=A0AAD8PSS7_9PEZI|nr:uncharacterized protein LY79DRAFT_342318 [Colletotrichum navitas]KAK1579434.1 hypothetical protein LY79DRAFT_342318 [Colletotrichum navitas]